MPSHSSAANPFPPLYVRWIRGRLSSGSAVKSGKDAKDRDSGSSKSSKSKGTKTKDENGERKKSKVGT